MAAFEQFAYVGSRTTRERNARGEGITVFGIDAGGQWHQLAITTTHPNPSFLVLDQSGRFLYTVHGDLSEVSAFSIGADGLLTHISTTSCAGLNPVHLAVDAENRHVIVVNHLTDSLVVLPRRPDGGLGPIVCYRQVKDSIGPHRAEQNSPKPHHIFFSALGDRAFISNKGGDSVFIYGYDSQSGTLSEQPMQQLKLREGSGPRNLVLDRAGKIAVLAGEIDSTITLLTVDGQSGLKPVQVVSSIPQDFISHNRGASIALSPDESKVLISNRGHNSVCVYDIDRSVLALRNPRWIDTRGRAPRFFAFEPGTARLCIANADTDTIVFTSVDGDGSAHLLASPSAVCMVFRPAKL